MKQNFIFLSILVMLVSCSKIESINQNIDDQITMIDLTEEELQSIMYDNDIELSEESVIQNTIEFFKQLNLATQTKNTDDCSVSIVNKAVLGAEKTTKSNDESDQISVYTLDVKSNGTNYYVIASGDRRSPGVIASFEDYPTDPIKARNLINSNNAIAMLTLAKKQLICDVQEIEDIRDELREKTINKICKELNILRENYDFKAISPYINHNNILTKNHGGVQMPSEQVITMKGPMSGILWEQYKPYNRACPEGNILIDLGGYAFIETGNVPAGCVTIACMNIEACLESPNIGGYLMDWDYYKEEETLFEAVAGQTGGTPQILLERAGNAIRHIYDQLGSFSLYDTYDGMQYVQATATYNGSNYIKSRFNYENHQTFDPDVVLSSLNANKPVYVSGTVQGTHVGSDEHTSDGHAYVIDGYIICKKATSTNSSIDQKVETRSTIVQYYDMYWHINLGWGEGSSAYFKLESDATCTPELVDKYGRENLVLLTTSQIISHISSK